MTNQDSPHNPSSPGCSKAGALAIWRMRIGRVLDPTDTESLGEVLDFARDSVVTMVTESNHRLVGVPRAVFVTAERLATDPDLEERIGPGAMQVIRAHINVNTWLWVSVDTTCAPLDEPC